MRDLPKIQKLTRRFRRSQLEIMNHQKTLLRSARTYMSIELAQPPKPRSVRTSILRAEDRPHCGKKQFTVTRFPPNPENPIILEILIQTY